MSLVRWAVQEEVTITNVIPATAVADATPVVSSAIDMRNYGSQKVMFSLDVFETNVANTGGTWVVKESATSGGSYTTATTSGVLTATGATAGNVNRKVGYLFNKAKPFVKVTFTGADTDTEAIVSANLVTLSRV